MHQIVRYPHTALRTPALPVTIIDAEVRKLAAQLLELMYTHNGLGLAAPQVAASIQLIVLNDAGDAKQTANEHVAVNPVVVARHGSQNGPEGCLSFPGIFQNVRRAKTVTIRAYGLDGNPFERTFTNLAARLWQHEIDHLHGRLFIDAMNAVNRLACRKDLRALTNMASGRVLQ